MATDFVLVLSLCHYDNIMIFRIQYHDNIMFFWILHMFFGPVRQHFPWPFFRGCVLKLTLMRKIEVLESLDSVTFKIFIFYLETGNRQKQVCICAQIDLYRSTTVLPSFTAIVDLLSVKHIRSLYGLVQPYLSTLTRNQHYYFKLNYFLPIFNSLPQITVSL